MVGQPGFPGHFPPGGMPQNPPIPKDAHEINERIDEIRARIPNTQDAQGLLDLFQANYAHVQKILSTEGENSEVYKKMYKPDLEKLVQNHPENASTAMNL